MQSQALGAFHHARWSCWALILLLLLSGGAAAQSYSLARSYRIGGEGGWDYLSHDLDSNHLFIARGNRVQVVDAKTGAVVGEVADTPGSMASPLQPNLARATRAMGVTTASASST